jgi:transposase InsO family protein
VEREVIQRFEFSSYYDAKKTFEAHLKWYNYTRKHSQLGKITPQQIKCVAGLYKITDVI